jgi:heat shock protein HslJ
MATSLLDGLKGLVTPELLSTAARTVGGSEKSAAGGLGAASTSILAALAGKAGTPQAMRPFFDLITDPANDDSIVQDPRLAASVAPDSPIGALGGRLLSSLFGSQQSAVGDLIARAAGLRSGSGGSLLSLAAPLVLGLLGNRARSGGLNQAGLASLIAGERDQIMRAAPEGLGSVLGLAGIGPDADLGVSGRRKSGRPRWLWPALAALAIVGVLWALGRDRRPAAVDETVGAVSAPVTDVADSVPPAREAIGAASSALPADVADVTWQWVSFTTPVEQITVEAPDRYTVRFGSDGRVALKADCNRGMGAYTVSADRRLALKPIALSRAMCPQGSLSDRFAKEVGRATSYFMKDGDLYLELPIDSGTLRFRRQA